MTGRTSTKAGSCTTWGDRTTKGIDFVDIATNKAVAQITGVFVGQAMKGTKLDNDVSGPNAMEVIGGNELWVGDGDSTIKVIDLNQRKLTATIPLGGKAPDRRYRYGSGSQHDHGDEQERLTALRQLP